MSKRITKAEFEKMKTEMAEANAASLKELHEHYEKRMADQKTNADGRIKLLESENAKLKSENEILESNAEIWREREFISLRNEHVRSTSERGADTYIKFLETEIANNSSKGYKSAFIRSKYDEDFKSLVYELLDSKKKMSREVIVKAAKNQPESDIDRLFEIAEELSYGEFKPETKERADIVREIGVRASDPWMRAAAMNGYTAILSDMKMWTVHEQPKRGWPSAEPKKGPESK